MLRFLKDFMRPAHRCTGLVLQAPHHRWLLIPSCNTASTVLFFIKAASMSYMGDPCHEGGLIVSSLRLSLEEKPMSRVGVGHDAPGCYVHAPRKKWGKLPRRQ